MGHRKVKRQLVSMILLAVLLIVNAADAANAGQLSEVLAAEETAEKQPEEAGEKIAAEDTKEETAEKTPEDAGKENPVSGSEEAEETPEDVGNESSASGSETAEETEEDTGKENPSGGSETAEDTGKDNSVVGSQTGENLSEAGKLTETGSSGQQSGENQTEIPADGAAEEDIWKDTEESGNVSGLGILNRDEIPIPKEQEDVGKLREFLKAPKVIEVSDLSSFAAAVSTALPVLTQDSMEAGLMALSMEEEETDGSEVFDSRCLLVRSSEGFYPCGAETVIQGYDNLFVLLYASAADTKKAYEYLQTIPYLTVEADMPLDIQTESRVPGENETSGGSKTAETKEQKETAPVTVAVLDTGYDFAQTSRERILDGWDVSGNEGVQDENGHGTMMADIIRRGSNPEVSVLPIRIADQNGTSTSLKLYLGMEYAALAGADILNISMSSYRPADTSLIAEEIKKLKDRGIFVVAAAGNYGSDTADFVPANIEDAIVVSAINANGEADGYSNHGNTIDYCAYGSVTAASLGGITETVSGTSVSAAIVSSLLARQKSECSGADYDAVLAMLDVMAEDLGEAGADPVFGRGALYADFHGEEEGTWESCRLLQCDVKQMSDEELNEVLSETEDGLIRFFLDRLSEEERNQLLARDTILTRSNTVVEYEKNPADGEYREIKRDTRRFYDYLYSEDFSEYYVQKKIQDHVINGHYYLYTDRSWHTVKVKTDQNGTAASIKVKYNYSTNPADNPKVSVEAANAGAFNFDSMSVRGVKTFTDDTGNANVIGQLNLNGIKVAKPNHSQLTGYSQSKTYPTGTWSGGVTDYGSNSCSADGTTIHFAIGWGDLEHNDQVYTVTVKAYGSTAGNFSGWHGSDPTCTTAGVKVRARQHTCKQCGAVVKTDTETDTKPALGHVHGHYGYAVNNGVVNGCRWLECDRYCQETGWQTNFEYHQTILFRYMDENGNYPAAYEEHVNNYYAAGTLIPGWSQKNDPSFQPVGTINAYAAFGATVCYIDVPRKIYHIVYDGNGADSGSVLGQNNICSGKPIRLAENKFRRKGYAFAGWSRSADGKEEILPMNQQKGLSTVHGETVTLYAQWEPIHYRIALDGTGNMRGLGDVTVEGGDKEFYEWYQKQFFQRKKTGGKETEVPITSVAVPLAAKVTDPILSAQGPAGAPTERVYSFQGFYDGSRQVVDISGKIRVGNHYFTSDQTIYARWEKQWLVYYDANVSEAMIQAGITADKIRLPASFWQLPGRQFTIAGEAAEVQGENEAKLCKFIGFNTMPDGSGTWYNSAADLYDITEDIWLYAQWDLSYHVAYIGNGQDTGTDFIDDNGGSGYIADPGETLTLDDNQEDAKTLYFTKTAEQTFVSPRKGDTVTAEVECRVTGWSMSKDADPVEAANDDLENLYALGADQNTLKFLKAAQKTDKTITYGAPAADFGSSDPELETQEEARARGSIFSREKGTLPGSITPEQFAGQQGADPNQTYVNLYAVWDKGPVIDAQPDLYYTLNEAKSGRITADDMLNYAAAWDEELEKEDSSTGGILKKGKDTQHHTEFTVLFGPEQFTRMTSDGAWTVTFQATDSAGNQTRKKVWVHVVDTTPRDVENVHDSIRFINKKHFDTLSENSIWRTEPYRTQLWNDVCNVETGENALWYFYFTNDTIKEMKAWVDRYGVGHDLQGFWDKFAVPNMITYEEYKRICSRK